MFFSSKAAPRRRSASTTSFSLQVVGARVSNAEGGVAPCAKGFSQQPSMFYSFSEQRCQAPDPEVLDLGKLHEVELIDGKGRRTGTCVLCTLARSCGGGYYDIVVHGDDAEHALHRSGRSVACVHESFLREHVPPSTDATAEPQGAGPGWALFAHADGEAGVLSVEDFTVDDHFVISRRHKASCLPEDGNWRFDGCFFCNDAGESLSLHPRLAELLAKEAHEHNGRADFLRSGPGIWFVRWAGSRTLVRGVPPSGFVGTDFPSAELQLTMNASIASSAFASPFRSPSLRSAAAQGGGSHGFGATAPAAGAPLGACAGGSSGSTCGRAAKVPQRSRSAARLPKLGSRGAAPAGGDADSLAAPDAEASAKTPGYVPVVCPFMEVSDIGLEKLTAACTFTCSDVVYDVGCGHGRMLDALLSRYPCRGVGIEVSPNLARVAKRRLDRFGDRVQIISKDVRHVDLGEATAVVMFFPPHAFGFVKAHLEQHLRPGCTLLNCTYPVPGWTSSFPVSGGWHRYEMGRHLPASQEP